MCVCVAIAPIGELLAVIDAMYVLQRRYKITIFTSKLLEFSLSFKCSKCTL